MKDVLAWHIASYPRSGNHLVRAILETYTHRPTEGALGAGRDTSIYARKSNVSGLVKVRSDQPIGYKAHFLREIHFRDRLFDEGSIGMILVTRDPVAAISSQATRILGNKRRYPWLTSRRKRLVIQEQIDLYLSLVFRFAANGDAPKVHVKFEDLLNPSISEQTVARLLDAVGAKLEGQPLSEVFELAMESQKSLANYNKRLNLEIKKEVGDKITYSEVLSYLNEPSSI